MEQAAILTFLSAAPLWRGLSEPDLQTLAAIAIPVSRLSNQVLFHEGEAGTGFYMVQSGRVKVYKVSADGKEQILGFFETGDHFAEVPALDGSCYPASAMCLQPTQLLFFRRQDLLALLTQYPELAMNILAVLAGKLRQFARLIEDLSLKEVPGRLATYLLYLSEKTQGATVELDMPKSQLAALLGTIPETLSRVFSRLQKDGVIQLQGATIELLNISHLQALSQGLKK